jgi:hypothetical protein
MFVYVRVNKSELLESLKKRVKTIKSLFAITSLLQLGSLFGTNPKTPSIPLLVSVVKTKVKKKINKHVLLISI